jgi:hypothetical protein
MAAGHGKDLHWLVDTVDLTLWIKTDNWEVNPDTHDITGSGVDDKSYRGGQTSRSFTLGGWLDDEEDVGPRTLEAIQGDTVTFERRPAGSGSGKRKQSGSVVVGKYVESSKNDDIVQWTCDFTVSGAVTEGTQS